MRNFLIDIGARIKLLFNKSKLEKDNITDEMTYVMFKKILKQNNTADSIKEYIRTTDFNDNTRMMASRESFYDICRIVRVMNCHEDKKYEDFFVDLKKFLSAMEAHMKLK